MHEFSLLQNVFGMIEEVAKANNLCSVTKVRLKIGKLKQVVPDFLRFAFVELAKGGIAEGAKLEIEEVATTVRCLNCRAEFMVEENVYICPTCDSGKLKILTGKEFVLETIAGDR